MMKLLRTVWLVSLVFAALPAAAQSDGLYYNYIETIVTGADEPIVGPLGLPLDGSPLVLKAQGRVGGVFAWKRDGTVIQGATTSTIVVIEPGTYIVEGTATGGGSYSSSEPVEVVLTRDLLTYTKTTTSATAGIADPAALDQLPLGGKQVSTTYADGLGRTVQTVQAEAAPNRWDAVAFAAYDAAGGSPKQYLPYARRHPAADPFQALPTLLQEQAAFYQGNVAKVATGTAPYSQTMMEASPLYRAQSASRVGDDARQHPRRVSEELNTAADAVQPLRYTPANPATGAGAVLDGSGLVYQDDVLTKVVTTDEDGRTMTTFQNERGQTILQRKTAAEDGATLDTYTLYDDLGRVSLIVPPAAVKELAATGWASATADAPFFDRWLYRYAYDARGRLTSRQFPGAGLVEFVYDRYDRLVLTRDGNRRAEGTWYYSKFDAQGRSAVEGVYTDSQGRSRAALQTEADNWAGPDYETRSGSAAAGAEYSNAAFPVGGTSALSVTLYDDYDLNGDGSADYSYRNQGLGAGLEPMPDVRAIGRVTLTRKRVVETTSTQLGSSWLTTVLLYDAYGNLIQKQSNSLLNNLPAGAAVPNTTTLVYREKGFVPQVLQSIHKVVPDVLDPATVRNRFAYDHAGRLLRVWQQNQRRSTVDAEVLVGAYAYNALGQLVEKNLHSQDEGRSFLQSVDLRYTLQGELASFNNSALTSDGGETNDDTNDVFGFVLHRQETSAQVPSTGLDLAPRYDGGIAAVRWQVRNANARQQNQRQRQRAYTFTYDGFGRLARAGFATQLLATGRFDAEPEGYNEDDILYDANGNLLGLHRNTQRRGTTAGDAPGATSIDRLTYTYDGNRLRAVEDAVTGPGGFRNGVSAADEYRYDANGNVTTDNNKGITYEFNVLNKVAVQRNTVKPGNTAYQYDAAGTVLLRRVTDEATGIINDYHSVEGVEYEVSTRLSGVASVPTPEGRTVLVTGTPPPLAAAVEVGEIDPDTGASVPVDNDQKPPQRFVYEYHLRDHQGNLRVAFRAETGQQMLRLTMETNSKGVSGEEGAYPLFGNVASTRNKTGTTAYQGTQTAAVTAKNPGPKTTLPVSHGDVVKLNLYYRTPAGVQYMRLPAAPVAAAPAPQLRLLPVLLPAPGPAGGLPDAAAGRPQPAGAVGLQLRLLGLLGGGAAARQQRLLAAAEAAAAPAIGTPLPAYVRWTLTGEDGKVLQTSTTPVPVKSTTNWTALSATFKVGASQEASRRALLRVELLNEASQPVYFDSLTLRHPRPALYISQENHYSPFGLALGGAAANTTPAEAGSQALYNGGSQIEDELLDQESANYSTPYRRYDPTLGRFLGVDPLADQYADQGTGSFAGNDPVNKNDPTGAFISDENPGARGQDRFRWVMEIKGNGGSSGYLGDGGPMAEGRLSKWAFAKHDERFSARREARAALKAFAGALEFLKSPLKTFPVIGGGQIDLVGYAVSIEKGGRVGLEVALGYKANGDESKNLKWFQMVNTDSPLKGIGGAKNEWSIDPQNENTAYPFYYTPEELSAKTNYLGYELYFKDSPSRDGKESFRWQAELSLVATNALGRYEPKATLSYGFEYNEEQGTVSKSIMELVQPSSLSIRMMNRKGR